MTKSKKTESLEKKLSNTQEKIGQFSDLLDSIDTAEDKKKMLWKEIYENAVTDRENAAMLFTEAYQQMHGGMTEHTIIGPTMSKYLERMCKSNEQILRLAELIAKSEERSTKIDPNDIFNEIVK